MLQVLKRKYFSRNQFECLHCQAVKEHCIYLGSYLDVGTCLWPKEINMIGQIASTGSPFPLLYDLSLSTANSGSSHRTPTAKIYCTGQSTEGFGAGVMLYSTDSTQLPLQVSEAFKQPGISSLNCNVQCVVPAVYTCEGTKKDDIN